MKERIKELIAFYLKRDASGRENATPRRNLVNYLAKMGIHISDRTCRKIYSEMPFVGYAINGNKRGLFWIMTSEEAFECERLRKSQGKSCIKHGADTAKAHGAIGQIGPWEVQQ